MIRDVRGWLGLLPPRERAGWALLLVLGVVTAALEGAAAIATYALLSVLVGGPVATQAGPVQWLLRQIGRADHPATAVTCAFLATGILVLKNLLQLLAAAGRARVGGATATAVSTRALRAYVTAPYVFHLRRHSSELSQNLMAAVPALVRLFDSVVILVSESLVIGGLFVLLCRVAWFETLVATVVIVAPLLPFVRISRRAYTRLGAANYDLGLTLHRTLDQAFGAIKELKVLGRERFFYDQAEDTLRQRARVGTRHAALENVPRLLAETSFIAGMLALVIVLAGRPSLGSGLLPFVGLYAYAGFRIVPAAHRIAYQVSAIHHALAVTASLWRDLATLPSNDALSSAGDGSRLPFNVAIHVDHVSYIHPQAAAPTLRDLDITIRHGACVGIVGATGAGKSTLIDLLLGLLEPTSGRITVDGRPVAPELRRWQRQLGYVPQAPFFVDDTLRRNIALGLPDDQIDEARIRTSAQTAQLDALIVSLPDGLDTIIGERGVRLSGGERQRLSVARALYHDPDVLIFDEATSSLDAGTERDLTRAIDQLRGRKTIIIIAHRLSTVEQCDRLLLLADGAVSADGTYTELLRTNTAFRTIAARDPIDGAPSSSLA
jgi:ATP-binding cassette subfamily C protein